MKLYVIRHGETIVNASNKLQGKLDKGLTSDGIKQAEKVGRFFWDKNIDLIISSPLERCKQTALAISNNRVKIIYDERLLGRDHGEFTGVPKESINFDEYWNYNKNVQYERAESVVDLYNRASELIEELKKEYKDKTLILVTHSGLIRVLYYYFNGIPEDGILSEIEIVNCSVFEYEV